MLVCLSVCLFVLAILAVWPSNRLQRWLLVFTTLCCRVLLTAAIIALAAAAIAQDSLREPILDALAPFPLLSWLREYGEADFRMTLSVSALVLALVCLPFLAGLDFARTLASHGDWIARLRIRLLAAKHAQSSSSSPPGPARPAPAQQRSLDDLLD